MKKTIYLLIGVAVLLAITILSPRPAAAQEDVGRLLHQLESDTDRFSKTLDNAMDHSSLNGSAEEGEITRYVKDFEDAVDRLKDKYEDREYASVAAQDVLSRAKLINKFLKENRLDAATQTDWASVKMDINRIAKVYKVRGLR
jgi:hypothetical protein